MKLINYSLCLSLICTFTVMITGQVCVPCAENSACLNATQNECPPNSKKDQYNSSCICWSGFYKDENGDCKPCDAGKYCIHNEQISCPLYSTSSQYSSLQSDCECLPGFEKDGTSCIACGIGKFKAEIGDGKCLFCNSSSFTASTQSETCIECTRFSASTNDRSKCICETGYYQTVEQTCVECTADHFCSNNNAHLCPMHSVTIIPRASAISDCMCEEGFFRSQNECIMCLPGSFADSINQTTCTLCPPNTFNPGYASKSQDSCIACGNKFTSPRGSTDRSECKIKQSKLQKKTGRQKRLITVEMTLNIPVYAFTKKRQNAVKKALSQTFSVQETKIQIQRIRKRQAASRRLLNEQTSFDAVIESETANVDSGSTEILSGNMIGQNETAEVSIDSVVESFVDEIEIIDCPVGSFLNSSSQTCIDCSLGALPIRTFLPVNDSNSYADCQFCPVHSVITGNVSGKDEKDCVCEKGYEFSELGFCTPCPHGYFKNTTGNEICTRCAVGLWQDTVGSSTCMSCPVNSKSLHVTQEACVCSPGFFRNLSGICMPCLHGFFKEMLGDSGCDACMQGSSTISQASVSQSSCLACAQDQFSMLDIDGAQKCFSCPSNSDIVSNHADYVFDACKCKPGYSMENNETCSMCAIGTYKSTTNNDPCLPCADGKTIKTRGSISVNDCVLCDSGFYATSETSQICVSCANNEESLASRTKCHCSASYYREESSGECSRCEMGFYKPIAGDQACTQCANHTIGTSFRNTSELSCVSCPVNHFKFVNLLNQNASCVACPNNSVAENALGMHECFCKSGFEYNAEDCANCSFCSACPLAKFKSSISNGKCMSCENGKYSASRQQTSCSNCPDHSSSIGFAATSISKCICQSGYEFQTNESTQLCYACSPGKYRSHDHNTELVNSACIPCSQNTYYSGTELSVFNLDMCTACPAHSTSMSGSYGIQSCTCDPGYLFVNDQCIECKAGFYCPNQHSEIQCSGPTFSAPGSFLFSNCTCLPGFVLDGLLCKRCPVNVFCMGGTHSQNCPGNSSTMSLDAQSNLSQCICHSGFYRQNDQCVLCPADMFCHSQQKTLCHANSTSVRGSTSTENCVCDAGFRRNDSEHASCIACDHSWICLGNDIEIECASSAYNNHSRCVCKPGYHCDSLESCTSTAGNCQSCTQDNFCDNNTKTACPEFAHSEEKSFAIEQCKCSSGYYRENNTCIPCPKDHYCYDESKFACFDFDINLITTEMYQSNIASCHCKAGFFRTSIIDSCKPCPKNHFCPLNVDLPNVIKCMPNEYTVDEGSDQRTDCLCDAGHKMSSADETFYCLPCEEGERCTGGEVVEFQCHVLKRTANADHSKCVCLPGLQEDDSGNCVPCDTGLVKPDIGDKGCTFCDANYYASNLTTCIRCRNDEFSLPGFSSCRCQAPTVRNTESDACEPCPANFFYDDFECHKCPANSTSAVGSSEISECLCSPGYVDVWNDGIKICEACQSGTYEQSGICQHCGVGAITPLASTSKDNCTCNASACQTFMLDENCYGECPIENIPCNACSEGTFKLNISSLGNSESCQNCSLHTFADTKGTIQCSACDPTRHTLQGSSTSPLDCVCRAGFEPNPTDSNSSMPCVACKPGHFKSDEGNHACNPCVVGSYAHGHQNVYCDECPNNILFRDANTTKGVGSVDVRNCTCFPGYFFNQETLSCIKCEVGSFKTHVGPERCTFCGGTSDEFGHNLIHHYSDGSAGAISSDTCIPCPTHSGVDSVLVNSGLIVMKSVHDCRCFGGFDQFNAQTGCVPCDEYKFRVDFLPGVITSFNVSNMSDVCSECPANHYFVSKYQSCIRCVLRDADDGLWHSQSYNPLFVNATWTLSESFCSCRLGHYRVGDTCHACPVGYYKNSHQAGSCSPCPHASYADETGTVQCKACPAYSNTSQTGMSSVTQCLCDKGYEFVNDECVACGEGKFKAATDTDEHKTQCIFCENGKFINKTAASACTECPINMISVHPYNDENACICDRGYGGQRCLPCEVGKYHVPGTLPSQRTECAQCPMFKTTVNTTSISQSACVCIPGHGTHNFSVSARCSPCASGTYSPGLTNAPCLSCGNFTITEPDSAATSFDHCLCNFRQGYYEDITL